MPAVEFERRGAVAWITLNRPEAKNIMNAEVFVLLRDAWAEVRSNDGIRVALVTAAGGDDFCCGGDLGGVIQLWMGTRQPENDIDRALLADPRITDKIFFRDEPMLKPVVAAVNGRALGGGCEMLLATDVRIAVPHATFGLPEPRSGIVPGAGSMVRLTRQIPYAHAMKLLLTAEAVGADEARDMGLISEIVEAGRLLDRAGEIAERIAANAPLALAAIKRTAMETHTMEWSEAFGFESAEAGRVMRSADAREGTRAFREKRSPQFSGE